MKVLGIVLKVLSKIFEVVPLAVRVAEAMGAILMPGEKTGKQKMEAVRKVVRDSILASELVAGKQIVDEVVLDQGIEEITEGTLKVMQAIREPK